MHPYLRRVLFGIINGDFRSGRIKRLALTPFLRSEFDRSALFRGVFDQRVKKAFSSFIHGHPVADNAGSFFFLKRKQDGIPEFPPDKQNNHQSDNGKGEPQGHFNPFKKFHRAKMQKIKPVS